MQSMSDELKRILQGRYQAGASGFGARVGINGPGISLQDTFSRPDQLGWGTADTGQVWQTFDYVTPVSDGRVAIVGDQGIFTGYSGGYVVNSLTLPATGRLRMSLHFEAPVSGEGGFYAFGGGGLAFYRSATEVGFFWYLTGVPYGPICWPAATSDDFEIFAQWSPSGAQAKFWQTGDPEPADWMVYASGMIPSAETGLWFLGASPLSYLTLFQVTSLDGTVMNGVTRISLDKSLQTDADAFEIDAQLADNDWGSWIGECIPDAEIRIVQWYGSESNAIQTFFGYLDKPDRPRDPTAQTITLTGRDAMKKAIVQGAIVTAPQGATEVGAVRDPSNYVFLNMEVSDIVTSLLSHLDFTNTVVVPTSYLVAEYDGADADSYAKMLSDMAALVGYRSYADEYGVYFFAPPQTGSPVAILRAGGANFDYPDAYDMASLEHATDDLELSTRVKVVGPMTTYQDAWTQTWLTRNVPAPTGVWYVPADPTHIRVLSGTAKKVYTLLQSTRAVTATTAAIAGTYYPAGLSGDPSDATIYWVLDAPWRVGSGVSARILKLDATSNAILATYTLNANHWSDIKVDGSVIWLANLTTGLYYTRSKADGSAIATYGPNYTGVVTATRHDPSGIAIDGTTAYLFFAGLSQMWRVDTTAPTVVLQTISTAGTGIIGGEVDTTTHTDLYACSDNVGDVWKYALKVATSNSVSVVVIAGVGLVDPEPTIPTGPLEASLNNPIRRLILQIPVITSTAQAAVTAQATLDGVDTFREVLTVGILANPAIQKGDIEQIVDDIMGESSLWVVDTYQPEMTIGSGGAGTFLGTLGLTTYTGG